MPGETSFSPGLLRLDLYHCCFYYWVSISDHVSTAFSVQQVGGI